MQHFKSTGLLFAERPSVGLEPTNVPDASRWGSDGAYTAAIVDKQLPSGLWVRTFNGSTSKITVTTHAGLNHRGPMTLCVWAYPTSFSGESEFGRLCDKDNATLALLNLGGPNVRFTVAASGNKVASSTGDLYTLNAWHFVVGKYDGANIILVLDGVSYTGAALTGNIDDHSSDNLIIGNILASTSTFSGDIALFKMLSYPLSLAQIKDIFEAERHWFGV